LRAFAHRYSIRTPETRSLYPASPTFRRYQLVLNGGNKAEYQTQIARKPNEPSPL
jgi:hypothetical protein